MCATTEQRQVSENESAQPQSDGRLDAHLQEARERASAHFEAALAIRDAETLRLQVLCDEFAPIVAARREASDFMDLAVVQSDPPRLWLDLTSYVVMAPDPRTFRLMQDTRRRPEILFETKDRVQMLAKLTEFAAHRTVERQRALPVRLTSAKTRVDGYSMATLLLAWLTGFSFGALALLVVWTLVN